MRILHHRLSLFALASLAACGGAGGASTPAGDEPEPIGSAAQADLACPDYSPLKNAYFGDLHMHTSFSLDAYGFGTRTDPAGAYAFASNQNGTANPQDAVSIASGAAGSGQTAGPTVTIDRPLDFLAVTDHSEFFNVDYGCTVDQGSGYYYSAYCVTLRNAGSLAQEAEIAAALLHLTETSPTEMEVCGGGSLFGGSPAQCAAEEAAAWAAEQRATTAAYNRCTFTSLHAYEWTASTGGNNLHRNVIFGSDQVPTTPLDYINYPSTHDLWSGLSSQCTGACSALTIPHNSNASGGQMFLPPTNAQDLAYMAQYQTLVEIHQHKGNSECFYDPADNENDPTCDFETLSAHAGAADAPGYVRNALESGLSYYAGETGGTKTNPFQLGIVGATDTHNATPGNTVENPRQATPGSTAEVDWPGNLGVIDDTPTLRVERNEDGCDPTKKTCATNDNRQFNPGGLTGVWAEQNSRDRIYAALQRREVFGTSGTRMKVRFYAYSGTQNPCADPSFPQQVVQSGGVPMGGTLGSVGAGGLQFVVYALQDATALAEVDIVKASVVNGQIVEQVQRIPVTQESGGAACVTWADTGYVAAAPAFYYARVLEQPVPRWSTYDCALVQAANPTTWQSIAPDCVQGTAQSDLIRTIQERAWTSPIWNLP